MKVACVSLELQDQTENEHHWWRLEEKVPYVSLEFVPDVFFGLLQLHTFANVDMPWMSL